MLHTIGWGRTNHAGGGDPNVLQHVISENYSGLLKPKYGNSDGVDGNARFYGVEIWYSGSHSMTDEQYYTLTRLGAAVCNYHSWSSLSVIGHGEWSNDKWDPGISKNKMANMSLVRSDISEAIKRGPNPVTVPKKSQTYKDVWESDFAQPPTGRETKDNPTWTPINVIRATAEDARKALANTEEILRILKAK
ncbi:peptidoglycan recognition protein family protein [Streptomyces hebeiensis]